MTKLRLIPALLATLLLAGCAWGPVKPQKGGSATVGPSPQVSVNSPAQRSETASVGVLLPSSGMPSATITQPENPQASSGQDVSYELEEEIVIPFDTIKTTVTDYGDGRKVTVQEPIPAGSRVIRKTKQRVEQNLGGSWKDTAREMAAALGSFQSVQYVGIAVFLLGAVSFFNVFLLKLVGGKDGALVVAGCGLLMMFGPFLFVTYAKWFFLAIVLAGVYWLLARFKYQHGQLDAIKSQNPTPPK